VFTACIVTPVTVTPHIHCLYRDSCHCDASYLLPVVATNIAFVSFLCSALFKWWAQYMESSGELDIAMRYYEASQDYLSLVRVYCFKNEIEMVLRYCHNYHLLCRYYMIFIVGNICQPIPEVPNCM